MTADPVNFEQVSIIDLIRYGASRFNEAGLTFGHSYDNALDEATQLVLHALHLPHDLSPVYGNSRVTGAEKSRVLALFERRIDERIPAAYLTGEAWFAGLSFKSDRRALVPRSPIAELIDQRLRALARRPRGRARARPVHRLGLHRHRDGALPPGLAGRRRRHQRRGAVAGAAKTRRACTPTTSRLRKSDLFDDLAGQVYDLIVTNPPYVTNDETDALPKEYSYEPELGLRAGDDGLDLALKILRDAPQHLSEHGLLICEVGEAETALVELLPELPMAWVEFKVGQMGIFVVERGDLVEHHATIKRAGRRARLMAPSAWPRVEAPKGQRF